ncbi:MAG: fructose PTS transporter subunit IIA, partial [Xanthomonadales bacterium]|nr:fructose PTS transporter subunit IIA [Xanthomonadales bacterium]
TGDGVRLEVSANIALPEEAPEVFANGAEGIGVFRTEMLFTGRQGPPGEEEQYRVYRKVADAAGDRPVIIRTFDIGGDKPVPWLQGPAEDNPFLGMRGARLYPERETEFRTQLRAMLRAAVHGGLRIMVPMISTPDELRWARGVYDDVCKTLEADGIEAAKAPFGIMLEVPSAVYSMGQLAPMSDFFSIGSNDLLQYFMAADRGNPRLGGLYDHYQPAFLRFLRELLGEAKTHGVFTGLCGDMASDESALPLLVGMGLDEISLVAPQIPRTKAALSRLDSVACTRLLDRAIACENSAAVLAELDSFQARHGGRSLFSEDLVVFAESAGSKQEAIKQLVDLAHLAGRTGNAAALETAVWQREDVFSTGLGFGIAIPHCKSAAVAHNSLCVARYTEPLDWQSRDGEPVDTVIMLIVNEHDAGEAHLKIFAQLARRIMHEEFRNGLRACADINSLLRYLVDAVED